ncbi:GFA family protein [Mesorhizobium sp. IMUNJ 23232]|uniref:GFA family protein n=1 Tax=Mesorhizobium sp. IMUNJ 23232 TaxID=3376064 RepID=UPI00379D1B3B
MAAKYQGGCLCGSVRYHADAQPINQRICHCRLCQRAIGAAFNARILFRIDDVTFDGMVATVHSSPDLKRGFCPSCGTTIFSRRDAAGIMGLTTGSLDDPSLFEPEMHIFTASKQPWVTIDDGLPQYEAGPPPT